MLCNCSDKYELIILAKFAFTNAISNTELAYRKLDRLMKFADVASIKYNELCNVANNLATNSCIDFYNTSDIDTFSSAYLTKVSVSSNNCCNAYIKVTTADIAACNAHIDYNDAYNKACIAQNNFNKACIDFNQIDV